MSTSAPFDERQWQLMLQNELDIVVLDPEDDGDRHPLGDLDFDNFSGDTVVLSWEEGDNVGEIPDVISIEDDVAWSIGVVPIEIYAVLVGRPSPTSAKYSIQFVLIGGAS